MADIKLYTVKDTSALFRVTRRTIYNRVKRGEMHPIKKGKYLYFTEEDLLDYLRS